MKPIQNLIPAQDQRLIESRQQSETHIQNPQKKKSLTDHVGKFHRIPETANVTPQTVAVLWVRMAEIFGFKWVNSYGATPSETWLAGLCDLTNDQVLEGIIRCMTWEHEWPPTLPQFRSLCQPRREECHKLYIPSPPEPAELVASRKRQAFEQINSIRDGLAFSEWLQRNNAREESLIDSIFRVMRSRIYVGKLSA